MLKEVIRVSKKYLTEISHGFNHPKVKVFLQDGVEFVRMAESKYDVIITDCSDLGPAEVLFQQEYFQYIHRALKPGGIMCLQGEQSQMHTTLFYLVVFLNQTVHLIHRIGYSMLSRH